MALRSNMHHTLHSKSRAESSPPTPYQYHSFRHCTGLFLRMRCTCFAGVYGIGSSSPVARLETCATGTVAQAFGAITFTSLSSVSLSIPNNRADHHIATYHFTIERNRSSILSEAASASSCDAYKPLGECLPASVKSNTIFPDHCTETSQS